MKIEIINMDTKKKRNYKSISDNCLLYIIRSSNAKAIISTERDFFEYDVRINGKDNEKELDDFMTQAALIENFPHCF